MLKIHLISTRGNILQEDLTGIVSDPKELKEYHQDLIRLCKEKHGVGVSANQVGLKKNYLFVTAGAKFPTNAGGKPTAHICVNPTWEPAAEDVFVDSVEGCLSLPGREFVVKRHPTIMAEWVNVLGHPQKKKLKGWAARVFQHEHDHLRGVTLLESGKEIKE